MTTKKLRIEPTYSQTGREPHVLVVPILAFMALFLSASFCFAESEVNRLIPPDARVIAGLRRMPQDQASSALWLATRNNLDDLNRVVALTASDPDRRLDYVVVADWPSSTDNLGSHLLIAQGRFSLPSILATMAHPKTLTFNGVKVLAVAAPAGSRQTARWLAIPQRGIAIFGTPSGVQIALERYRSKAPADPAVIERLRRAHDGDQAWSSVMLQSQPPKERVNLDPSSDNLLPCLSRMREVDLGIQLGKNVTVDLHTESRDGTGSAAMQCASAAIFKNYAPSMRVSVGGEGQPSMRLALTRSEYDRWLDSFRKSNMNQTLQAFISGAESGSVREGENLHTIR